VTYLAARKNLYLAIDLLP